MNYKRKHKLPRRSRKCSICMSQKLAHGRLPDKEKKMRKEEGLLCE